MNDIYYNHKKCKKIEHNPDKHIMNKPESQMLRKLKSKTGLTEEQLRADVKYRRLLSQAQKESQVAKRSEKQKYHDSLVKEACKKTKLAKEHPQTIEVLQQIINDKYDSHRIPWYLYSNKPSAYQLVGVVKRKQK